MSAIEKWLRLYGESHQNSINIIIHKICVPVILYSILGILWFLPVPLIFKNVPFLNWMTLFSLCSLMGYSFFKSIKVIAIVLGFLISSIAMNFWLMAYPIRFNLMLFAVCFVIAWVFQFIGHTIEGKRPSFLNDIRFLFIGPIWIFSAFFRIP